MAMTSPSPPLPPRPPQSTSAYVNNDGAYATCPSIPRAGRARGGPCVPEYLEENLLGSLRALNRKLRRYVLRLVMWLAVMVLVLTVSVPILNSRHPGLFFGSFDPPSFEVTSPAALTSASAAGSDGEAVAPSEGHVSLSGSERSWEGGTKKDCPKEDIVSLRDRFWRCGKGGDGGGRRGGGERGRRNGRSDRGRSSDAETAFCQLIEAKVGLDARTKRLHEDVNRNNRQLEDLINNHTAMKNLSDAYSRRRSAHLHFYYHDPPGKAVGLEPVLWVTENGLSSLYDMDVIVADKHSNAIVSIRVNQIGYYYVYSQVAFKPEAESQWSKIGKPLHCLYKNYGNLTNPSCRRAMLANYWTLSMMFHVSYVQGVFLLKAGETLTVVAPIALINTIYMDHTFFGAFQI